MCVSACGGAGLGVGRASSTQPLFPSPSVPPSPPSQKQGAAALPACLSFPGSTVTPGSPCAWQGCGGWRRSVCPRHFGRASLTSAPHSPRSPRLTSPSGPLQCHLSGCMMDLFLQMAIIMGLKQTLSNCVEYLGP